METLEKFAMLGINATSCAMPINYLTLCEEPQTLHVRHEASPGFVWDGEVVMKEGQMVSFADLSVILARQRKSRATDKGQPPVTRSGDGYRYICDWIEDIRPTINIWRARRILPSDTMIHLQQIRKMSRSPCYNRATRGLVRETEDSLRGPLTRSNRI